ncbi:MAG: glycine betaine ABC transporter substrate-binding protein [Halanaerobacter sp.]
MAIIKQKTTLLIALMVVSLVIVGCGGAQQQGEEAQQQEEEVEVEQEEVEQEEEKKKITLGYVQWASAEASTFLMEEVLERAGYDVERMTLQAGAMYQGLSTGDLDAMVCAWLPKTHKSYWEEYGNDLVDLGTNYEGARIGLAVPEYVDVDSIEELKNNADKFDNRIVGVDPGAGIMGVTSDTAMDEYGLSDWDLVESSGPAMTATLEQAINQEEAVVVTGWTPHWKWFSYDLKFLEDPKGVYGEPEDIKTLGRTGIEEDQPGAAKILKKYKLNDDQLGELIKMAKDADDLEKAAAKYVDQNKELVNEWLPKDKKLN